MEQQDEIWKEIPIAPKYEVSNLGRVRNKSTLHVLKQGLINNTYPRVNLCTVMGEMPVLVARQVLIAFTPHLEDLTAFVGYRDDNPQNTNLKNLYWKSVSQTRKECWSRGIYTKQQTYVWRKRGREGWKRWRFKIINA